MKYIAILDYNHLDNGMFMQSFAEALAGQQNCRAYILHGDSLYTNRLLQTGMMREEAVVRSTRDLNNRIIALLADSGVAGIGINGYQKDIITSTDGELKINHNWLDNLPGRTHLVISNLVKDQSNGTIGPVPLNHLAHRLSEAVHADAIVLFPTVKNTETNFSPEPVDKKNSGETVRNPESLIDHNLLPLPANSFLCTIPQFKNLPETRILQKIDPKK
ncbi:hypothetical protein [Natronogracilivirga saccharolytica]|uniref:Uncharacterized protein n=1 Tax=Natronogracilivirga saccharolytica TaxID=2812953 RepID=A0A8J7UVE3_9BACT|nr:hypothetical protein [Natronogracilivirga saccharolytica]MBP3192467.1 hypothetical protein [Natronogracilivirga saccharolytica]